MLSLPVLLGRGVAAVVAVLIGGGWLAPSRPLDPASWSATKKGVAAASYLWSDPQKLRALNATWTYGWSADAPGSSPGLDVVPMVWGAGATTDATMQMLARAHAAGKFTSLLGFNEPDNPSQAAMSPQAAAALWPRLESTGLRLGSPAPANPNDGWLASFMALANSQHLRVDFIALHFYPDFTNPTAVSAVINTVKAIYARYGKPIWITELGTVDIRPWGEHMSAAPTMSAAVTFMSAVSAALDGLSCVQRYAWFSDNVWATPQYRTSSMYDASGALTALGQRYQTVR